MEPGIGFSVVARATYCAQRHCYCDRLRCSNLLLLALHNFRFWLIVVVRSGVVGKRARSSLAVAGCVLINSCVLLIDTCG